MPLDSDIIVYIDKIMSEVKQDINGLKDEIREFNKSIIATLKEYSGMQLKIQGVEKDLQGFIERYEIRHTNLCEEVEHRIKKLENRTPTAWAKNVWVWIALGLGILEITRLMVDLIKGGRL